jgi:hypothetical protein
MMLSSLLRVGHPQRAGEDKHQSHCLCAELLPQKVALNGPLRTRILPVLNFFILLHSFARFGFC